MAALAGDVLIEVGEVLLAYWLSEGRVLVGLFMVFCQALCPMGLMTMMVFSCCTHLIHNLGSGNAGSAGRWLSIR